MREASPFQINTTHAHRASIYLYETRRIELSSNPGYLFVRPLSFPLFSPAILARRGCGTGENPRRYRFDIDFLENRSTRGGIIGDRLCLETVETIVGQSLFDSISSVDRRKRSAPKSSFIFEDLSVKRGVGIPLE